MALNLIATVPTELNRILPLTPNDSSAMAIRVATATSGKLLTLQATGSTFPAANLNWTLSKSPAWVTLQVDPTDPSIATLTYTNATPNLQGMHQFFVRVNDGDFVSSFVIALDVKKPFYLVSSSPNDTVGIDPNDVKPVAAYDAAVPDTIITPYGLSDAEITSGDVYFLQAENLPDGLELLVGITNSRAILRVAQPTATDESGGIKVASPYTQTIQIRAYQPNSMYDLPDDSERTYVKNLTLNTNTQKKGTFQVPVSCVFDGVNSYFTLQAHPSFAGGKGTPLVYAWSIVSGTGSVVGTSTAQTFHWAPSGASGNVTFALTVSDAANSNTDGSKVVLETVTIGPIPYSVAGSNWNTTDAIKIEATSTLLSGPVGEVVQVTVSTPAPSDTVTVTFSSSEGLVMPANLTLTPGSPSGIVSFTIPTSSLKTSWSVLATATAATRSGAATLVVESAGKPILVTASSGGTALTQATGSLMTPSTLGFTYNAAPVTIDNLYMVNPPAGLRLSVTGGVYSLYGASPINTVLGTPFAFKLLAIDADFSPSYTAMTLAVTTSATPIAFSSFTPSSTHIADGTAFTISWSYPTTPATLWLQKNLDAPTQVEDHSYQTLSGDAVFSLTGTNFYGTSYAPPFLMVSDTSANLTKLPGAKTTAIIDSSDLLTLKWSPVAVNETFSLYKGWVVDYAVNSGSPTRLSESLITGLDSPLGTLASRVYTQQLSHDNIALSMRAMSASRVVIGDSDAWPDLLDFPTLPTLLTFALDKATARLGESVTVVMAPDYLGATSWRAIYSDGVATEWLPISLKSATHAFSIEGSQTVTIEIEKTFAEQDPIVSLKRSLVLSVFVENQMFQTDSVNAEVLGNIGLGGTAGFEITDSASSLYAVEPYEVVTRSLVKDEVTQEIKLLIATSRNNNSSSVQGTMALDVFPLAGRPHMKNLVVPSLTFEGQTTLVAAVNLVTESLPDAVVGKSMVETQLQATGGTAPYDWFSSNLPQGLTLNTDGTLSGTPMQMGVYSLDVAVKDSTTPAYIDSRTLTMSIVSDLTIAESSAPSPQVGQFYLHALPALGGVAPYTWRLASGELPIGLTIEPVSGCITGYPCTYNSSTDFSKTFLFTPEVVDSIGARVSKQLFMTLNRAPITLGGLDQTVLFKEEDAKLVIPVFGGHGSYNVLSLSSDGAIGDAVALQSPEVMDIVSGVTPTPPVVTTGRQLFSPAAGAGVYPYTVIFPLTVSGGVPGYRFSIDTSNPSLNTLTDPTIIDGNVFGTVPSDGHYSVNVKCVDTDGFGANTSQVILVDVNDNSNSDIVFGVPTVSLEYVGVKKNASNNTANWTFRKLTASPDAKDGVPYKNLADATEFYGLALWDNDLSVPVDVTTLPAPVTHGGLSTTIQAGGRSQYTPLGISSFNGGGAWGITPTGAGVFNSGSDLPAGYGVSDVATNNFIFVLFADSTTGSAIPVANQKIVRTVDPVFGTLSNYQIGTLTYYASNGAPLYSKSLLIYCSLAGGGATPVVCMTSDVPQFIDGDIFDPASTTYSGGDFTYPLTATGGSAPYSFAIASSSDLPGATIGDFRGTPSLKVSASSALYRLTSATSFTVRLTATDKNGIISQTLPLTVAYLPKASLMNPIQIVGHTYLQEASVATPTFRGYTGADLLPLDVKLWANQEVVWSLPPAEQANFESLGLVFTTKPDNSFQISGTPTTAQRYTFNVTAAALGSGSDTRTYHLDIVDPIVKVYGPSTPLTIGAKYNFATNHSIVHVHQEGYRIVTSPIVLHTNLGTLEVNPTNINITSDIGLGNPGNPLYAQSWDAYYDFSSASSGNGVFSVTGAPVSTPAGDIATSFSVAAVSLVARGIVQPVAHVSEYAATFAPVPPLVILGGVPPYTYTVESLSNPTNFSVNGSGQLELRMSSVSATNQPGTCDVTYQVVDSASSPVTTISTAGTVSVIVDAETYIDIDFLPKEWVFTAGTSSSFPLFGCCSPRLGHAPYQWTVINLSVPVGCSAVVGSSASNRILSYNNSLVNLALKEFVATDYLSEASAGVWTSTPSGGTYYDNPNATLPSQGRHAITVDFQVSDANGLQTTGTTTVTLVAP